MMASHTAIDGKLHSAIRLNYTWLRYQKYNRSYVSVYVVIVCHEYNYKYGRANRQNKIRQIPKIEQSAKYETTVKTLASVYTIYI